MISLLEDSFPFLIFECIAQGVASVVLAFVFFLLPSWRVLFWRLALFNLFFLGWSCLGNFLWEHLTSTKLIVADDCPVWFPFVPFGRDILESAGPWRLLGDTSLAELRLTWAVIALPVWALSFLTLFTSVRFTPYAFRYIRACRVTSKA